MIISKNVWNNYINTLRAINDKAAETMMLWMKHNGGDGLLDLNVRDGNGNNIIDAAFLIVKDYGSASAAVSAEMYDAIAALSGVKVPPAALAETPDYAEVAKTINGTLGVSQNREEIASATSRLVKRTGVRTTRRNARRDGAETAWIPNGDTCAFCIMLASRGWERGGGSGREHIHSNCDCTYAVRFNPDTDYAGYDSDKYLEEYENAEGNTWQEKLNSMRRDYYYANSEEINKNKRMRYAERTKLLNSSAAEETDV